jgi:hypothetical protein
MSVEALYQSLLESSSLATIILSSRSDENPCFELAGVPLLQTLVLPKYPSVKYVNIETLQSDGEVVLNVSLFDTEGEQLGGAEITKTAIFWDDTV